jgi:hypothetical protein
MARQRVRRLYPLALSIGGVCECLDGISAARVRSAIAAGSLGPVYQLGTKKRIPVESVLAWLKTWPRAELKKLRSRK